MWRANIKTWVTRQFFTECVKLVFGSTVKKYLLENNLPFNVLLVLDNAPTYPPNLKEDILEELNFIQIQYLLPMDQQMISDFKKSYTKHLFHQCFRVTAITNLTLREFSRDRYNIVN